MKNLKRTLGLLLAMIMALSLPLTAHAAVLSNTASNWNGTYYCVSCGRRLFRLGPTVAIRPRRVSCW